MILEGIEMANEKKDDPNLVQFRRYAEAALAGIDHNNLDYDVTARIAFGQATEMMMMENFYFEQYQIQALEHVVAKQRIKHGIEEPIERSKVF
jgi:hypothetical protein